MSYAITFNHQGNEVGFVTTERELKHALLRGFHLLIQELGQNFDSNTKAQDSLSGMTAEQLEDFSFTTDPYAYRSTLQVAKYTEISYEECAAIMKHAEYLNVYC